MKQDPAQAGQDRQSLAEALRDLRLASGLSGDRLARRCGMSQSKVSRIETGHLLPSVIDVQQILTALGVDAQTCDDLLSLARVANAEYEDSRATVRRGLHHTQRQLASLEASATLMRHFLPTLITGLLQTPAYIQAAMTPPVEPATGDVSRAVELKVARQAVLRDDSKKFEFLLTESAARWQLCEPHVMADQLDHLVAVSRLPNVRIGLLPLSRRVREGAYHTFVTYDRRLVTIELFAGSMALRDPKDIDYFRDLFDFFSEQATWADEARTLLQAFADDFRSRK